MSGSATSTTHPAGGLRTALGAVRTAPTILEALRRVDIVTAAAGHDDRGPHAPGLVDELRAAATDSRDGVVAVAAVHALAAHPHPGAAACLVELLGSGDGFLTEQAAWALGDAAPVVDAVPALARLVVAGGLRGMLAQRTLERWAPRVPDAVLAALEPLLADRHAADAVRATVVETVGLVPGRAAMGILRRIADDLAEPARVRVAAAEALGDRFTRRTRLPTPRGGADPHRPGARHDGRTVVQLFLHADIDGELTSAGKGDTGGIATLLVNLGNTLLEDDRGIDRVITISRGRPADWPVPEGLHRSGHHYAQVPLWGPRVGLADAWMHRVAVRRGVARILTAAGHVDAIHLRMADVGSMAAAEAAADLGIPVVFTLAPDPQALMAVREASGTLTRAGFAAADAVEHLSFRDALVRELAARADHLVLFPRPDLDHDARDLLGLDLEGEQRRATVIAEGIDLRAVDRAAAAQRPGQADRVTAANPAVAAALSQLDDLLSGLPPERRALPLAVTVGRLNRVKGMATLVQAWTDHAALRDACNLLVVGGDLDDPSPDEAAELARIDAAVPREEAARRGLLLPGHQPHATVAAWLAATARGRPGLAGPGGVYLSASLKEEFGLAILEAMAANLLVVAPDGGGPATYVEQGVTGILTDTASPVTLAAAATRVLGMAASPATAMRQRRALATLRERFGIATMAGALATVYADVSADCPAVGHEPGAASGCGPAEAAS